MEDNPKRSLKRMQSVAMDDEEWECHYQKLQKTEAVPSSELASMKRHVAQMDANLRRLSREYLIWRDDCMSLKRENGNLRHDYERMKRDNDQLRQDYERTKRENDRLRDNYERVKRKQNAMCQRLGVIGDLGRLEDER